MTEENNLRLIRLAQQGDRDAEEQLLQDNSGLIWSIARRYFGRGADPDDLYQLGSLGLIKAVRNFDLEYGTRFSTYAVPKISGEIRRFLRDDGDIKVSRSIKEAALTLRLAKGRLEQRLGREPSLSELSQETGISPEDIARCETATAATESLQQETGEDGFSLEQVLSDVGAEERLLEGVALREAIATLPEKERTVIALRYYRGLTQQAAAKIMQVSQVQISRIERRAVEQLKKHMTV